MERVVSDDVAFSDDGGDDDDMIVMLAVQKIILSHSEIALLEYQLLFYFKVITTCLS